jgi:hypothetical protein
MRLLVCALLALGCSDDGKVRHLPDAPPPPDSNVDAATFGAVSLSIFEGTDPRVGVRVIFQNADSSVVSDTTTGSDGKATAMMAPGGYVTAIDPYPNTPQGVASSDLRTFAGVKPGDQLRLFQPAINGGNAITVNVMLPIAANAIDYRVSTNCFLQYSIGGGGGSGSQPTGIMQIAGCGPTSNLLVEAFDEGAVPIAFFYKQNVALVDNATLDLTTETYTATPDSTFTYTNVPAAVQNMAIYAMRATSLGTIYENNIIASVAAGGATATAKLPPIPNASAVTASTFLGAGNTQHILTEWGPATTTYALDTSGLFLPDFATPPALAVAANGVTWTVSGGDVQPDLVLMRAFLGRESPLLRWAWTIAAPAGTQVAFPRLPDASQFNLVDGDFASFELRTAKVPGGYDAVRASILATQAPQQLAVGAAGKASFAIFVEQSALTSRGRGLTR